MKREWDDSWGEEAAGKRRSKGGKGKGGKSGKPCNAVFKALFPDASVSAIIGSQGVTRKQIEDESGAVLQISGRGLYFPGTQCRVLTVTSDEPWKVTACMNIVFDKLVERADADLEFLEGKGKGRGEMEDGLSLLGKEPGEYVYRILLPPRCSGALIGPKGANIKALRHEIGAKVFVENDIHDDHQLVRVIGFQHQLRSLVDRIYEITAKEMSMEQAAAWASVSVALEGFSDSWASEAKTWKDLTTGDQPYYEGADGGPQGHLLAPRAKPMVASSCSLTPLDAASGVASVVEDFPAGSLDMEHAITCELPKDKVPMLIGGGGKFIKQVKADTGCTIAFENAPWSEDPHELMTITGPLCSVYLAHMLMMKKFHDLRLEEEAKAAAAAAEQPPAAAADPQAMVESLQAQLKAMQDQLNAVTRAGGVVGTRGKGTSKKGKR